MNRPQTFLDICRQQAVHLLTLYPPYSYEGQVQVLKFQVVSMGMKIIAQIIDYLSNKTARATFID